MVCMVVRLFFHTVRAYKPSFSRQQQAYHPLSLSFDPAAFYQVYIDPVDLELATPVIPAAEPAGYVSPLYDPCCTAPSSENPTSPRNNPEFVLPPAVQYNLRRKIARFLNDPPYEPADTEPYPDPMDPKFETYFAMALYRYDPNFAVKVEALAKAHIADDSSLSSVGSKLSFSMTESETDWRSSPGDRFVGNDLWTSEIEDIASQKAKDYLTDPPLNPIE
jgi:hypothetical protein